jgi:GTP-binding protein
MHLANYDDCIIADIPGLIEGAHTGAGLGHKFLRHIERTRILLHVIDASSPEEQPLQEYRTLENELRVYNEELMDRQRLVVLNKIDLLEDEQRLAALQELFFKAEGVRPLAISALTEQGLAELREVLGEMLNLREMDSPKVHRTDEDS